LASNLDTNFMWVFTKYVKKFSFCSVNNKLYKYDIILEYGALMLEAVHTSEKFVYFY
jgi:hypothetical protein